jgi:hypothetical protein
MEHAQRIAEVLAVVVERDLVDACAMKPNIVEVC